MTFKKRIICLALSALVLPANLFAQQGAAAPRVLVDAVVSKQPTIYRKYTAEFEPIEKVTSLARVSGILQKINFKEGDMVEKEQVLFEIEPVRYEAAVKAALSRIDVIKAKIRYAQNNYDRNKELAAQQAVAKDTAENTLSILEGFQAELLGAEADLTLAQEDLNYTKIISRLTGRVGRVNYTEGNYITPASGPLVTVVQIDPIYVRFSMSERDFTTLFGTFDRLKETTNLSIQMANGENYGGKGEISFIDNQLSQHTNSLQIWATYENPQGVLNPGGLATVLLAQTETKAKPAVIMSAVMFDRQGHFVYTTEKRSFEDKDRTGKVTGNHDGVAVVRRDVILGPTDGEYQVIESGLTVGETVLVDGTHKAIPGSEIIPVQATQSTENNHADASDAQTADIAAAQTDPNSSALTDSAQAADAQTSTAAAPEEKTNAEQAQTSDEDSLVPVK